MVSDKFIEIGNRGRNRVGNRVSNRVGTLDCNLAEALSAPYSGFGFINFNHKEALCTPAFPKKNQRATPKRYYSLVQYIYRGPIFE